jgi:hypothetical protein
MTTPIAAFAPVESPPLLSRCTLASVGRPVTSGDAGPGVTLELVVVVFDVVLWIVLLLVA